MTGPGKIHGLISREQAAGMWAPYGQRVIPELDGNPDPDLMTPDDVVQVVAAANEETQSAVYWGLNPAEDDSRMWLDVVREAAVVGFSDEIKDWLYYSQSNQQAIVEHEREVVFEEAPKYIALVLSATRRLVQKGVLSNAQANTAAQWLANDDGTLRMQPTPMSRLEYARFDRKFSPDEVGLAGSDSTDFRFGILVHARSASTAPGWSADHNKLHETVHGGFAGVEMWDITNEREQRMPMATVVGHFATEPTTRIVSSDNYSGVKDAEICEGLTDFLTRSLIEAEPALGPVDTQPGGYQGWAKGIGSLKVNYPNVYESVVDAAFVEATPSRPTAKRDALAEMHAYADTKLGCVDSLTKFVRQYGGSLTDIYTKGT